MIKPDKPWPRRSGNADGCWQDPDRIEVPVYGWPQQPPDPPGPRFVRDCDPPRPPTVEYAFRRKPDVPSARPSAGAIWQMLAVIAVSVTIGIYIGRHLASS